MHSATRGEIPAAQGERPSPQSAARVAPGRVVIAMLTLVADPTFPPSLEATEPDEFDNHGPDLSADPECRHRQRVWRAYERESRRASDGFPRDLIPDAATELEAIRWRNEVWSYLRDGMRLRDAISLANACPTEPSIAFGYPIERYVEWGDEDRPAMFSEEARRLPPPAAEPPAFIPEPQPSGVRSIFAKAIPPPPPSRVAIAEALRAAGRSLSTYEVAASIGIPTSGAKAVRLALRAMRRAGQVRLLGTGKAYRWALAKRKKTEIT